MDYYAFFENEVYAPHQREIVLASSPPWPSPVFPEAHMGLQYPPPCPLRNTILFLFIQTLTHSTPNVFVFSPLIAH